MWIPEILVAHHRREQGWDETSRDFSAFEIADKVFYKRLDWPAELATYDQLLDGAARPPI
jgi:hypothetical protein